MNSYQHLKIKTVNMKSYKINQPMNEDLREELYNYMIQSYNELTHDEIINTIDILEKLEFEEYLYEDKDYLYDQIENIVKY